MAVVLQQDQRVRTDATIPIIDLAPYLAGAPGALEATAAQVRDALETIGFFIIINHDVPQDLIDRTFAQNVFGLRKKRSSARMSLLRDSRFKTACEVSK